MTDEQRPAPAMVFERDAMLAEIDQQRETIQAQAEEIERLKDKADYAEGFKEGNDETISEIMAQLAQARAEVERLRAGVREISRLREACRRISTMTTSPGAGIARAALAPASDPTGSPVE